MNFSTTPIANPLAGMRRNRWRPRVDRSVCRRQTVLRQQFVRQPAGRGQRPMFRHTGGRKHVRVHIGRHVSGSVRLLAVLFVPGGRTGGGHPVSLPGGQHLRFAGAIVHDGRHEANVRRGQAVVVYDIDVSGPVCWQCGVSAESGAVRVLLRSATDGVPLCGRAESGVRCEAGRMRVSVQGGRAFRGSRGLPSVLFVYGPLGQQDQVHDGEEFVSAGFLVCGGPM